MKNPREAWPPYCCVPAFVDVALRHFNFAQPTRDRLASDLGVTVPEGVDNPLSLPLASTNLVAGLTPSAAVHSINRLLAGLSPDVRLRHLPFSEIAMQLYEDVAAEALRREVIVGIGLDWNRLSLSAGAPRRHLLRLLHAHSKRARLIDDSLESGLRSFDVAWDEIERSVGVVDDGFWLIGAAGSLQFAAAEPWLPVEYA